jgi:hypothetical protein
MRFKNPAYTEIVGRETDLKGRRLRGNPIFGQESNGKIAVTFSEISTVLA